MDLTKIKAILNTAPTNYTADHLFYSATKRVAEAAKDFADLSLVGLPSAERIEDAANRLILAVTDAGRIADAVRALRAVRDEVTRAIQQQAAEKNEQEVTEAF